jgi:hypothetical protein
MKDITKALYKGKETDVELVKGALVGDKIATSGMLLEPYEAVIEGDGSTEIYGGLPEDNPKKEWMEDSEEGSY